MSSAFVGFCVSGFCVLLFALLFRYEKKRGVRFGEHVRMQADVYVLRSTRAVHTYVRHTVRDLMRQLVHYMLHSILRSTLDGIKRMETWLRTVMRMNKALAKRAERESATRTKLEEVALHKATYALTEDEKRIKRQRELNEHM